MSRRRQRGVALLAALLVVALALVLVASLVDGGEASRARAQHALRAEQSWQLLIGLEGWAARMLREDENASPGVDSFADLWAQELPPTDIEGGSVRGRLRELGGCLDLNGLWRGDTEDALASARLRRLLLVLSLDPNLANRVLDWIDPDGDPRPGGAEDARYRVADPPRRAANRPFVHLSELRLVDGVDPEVFRRLAPHVCVLPEPVPLNLNTASPQLWQSLADGIGEGAARRLSRDGRARYESIEAVRAELEREGHPEVPLGGVGVTSRYFVAEAEIDADGLPFLYSALIERDGPRIRVLARVRGRW